jgi:hypothetical protein
MAHYLCGDGATLQDAGDDLLRRLRTLALQEPTGGGVRWTRAGGRVDHRWFDFLHELAELVARGTDIRARVFGTTP